MLAVIGEGRCFMDQPFESEVMEELTAETPFSSSDELDEFAEMEEDSFGNENILEKMYGFEDFETTEEELFLDNNGFDEGFEDSFEGGFEDDLEYQAFAELNGDNGTDQTHEFDDFELWELGAEELDAASAKTKQKRASIERQRQRRQRQQQKRKQRRPTKQALPTTSASSLSPVSAPTRSSWLNRLRGEVYANLPQVFQTVSDPRTKSVLRTVGAALGNTASPTLRTIGQGIGALLNSLPADEFEAMEAMFDWAEEEDAIEEVAPAIARLTISKIAPQLPSTIRTRLLRSIIQASHLLSQRQGPKAARAIPAIVQSVMKTAQRRRMPVQALPQAVQRTAAQVAANRALLTRLATSPQN
jgi:hypothetical protein